MQPGDLLTQLLAQQEVGSRSAREFQDRRIQPLCHLSKCPLTPILIAAGIL
jgi:hypothetical protein